MRGPKLSLKQEQERTVLRESLRQLLGERALEDFDDERFVGTHEMVVGTQWHVALDRAYLTCAFAVNLEGLWTSWWNA